MGGSPEGDQTRVVDITKEEAVGLGSPVTWLVLTCWYSLFAFFFSVRFHWASLALSSGCLTACGSCQLALTICPFLAV